MSARCSTISLRPRAAAAITRARSSTCSKLLDLDSSLAERKELAQELGVHAGEDGSAEQNIALHKAVMQKLAENGGIVPASMRD